MVRIGITLPEWYERKLVLWAKIKGTNRATLISNIVQARIEANWEQIEKDLQSIADYRGVTTDELIAEWLEKPDEG